MRVGLALGGGGAKGIAHVPVLETFDALGVRPARIAGTSMGAVIGALYASGLSGEEMREELESEIFLAAGRERSGLALARGVRAVLDVIDLELGKGGLIRGERFLEVLYEDVRARRFDELHIPLKVVATDFWSREQVVLESGDLLPAIRASMALPVLFSPVVLDERVLMDGGAVNPIPYDLLLDDCDLTVAVDVTGRRSRAEGHAVPTLAESIFNTFQIMSKAIVDEKARHRPPDIWVRPDLVDVQLLEFERAQEIYAQAVPACRTLRTELERALERAASSPA